MPPGPRIRYACLAIAMTTAGMLAAASASDSTPAELVKTASDKVLVILQDKRLKRDERWRQVSEILRAHFDFEGISRSVLATNWRKASVEEQRQFTEFFSQYLEEVYRTRIENYTDQEIRIDKEQLDGGRAVVDTTIVSDQSEIPVSYRMRNNHGAWMVYDVVVEGQSMVNSYRNTFQAIAQTGGMQGLLADVQRRIDRQKSLRLSKTE